MNNNEQTEIKEVEEKKDWISDELGTVQDHTEYDELPSMKFVEKKITEITIDFSVPFDKWEGEQNDKPIIKKIIKVTHENELKNWWLNVKNPIYKELLTAGKEGKTSFKILQTGTQGNTRYSIVE